MSIRTAHVEQILVYNGGAQLLVARGPTGVAYLCLLVDRTRGDDTYLCATARPDRLRGVGQGEIDLRNAFDGPERPDWFTGRFPKDAERVDEIRLKPLEVMPESWLPRPGVMMSDLWPPFPSGA